jgi:uncharacterized coiled-coil DUF342 family protein
LALLGLLSSSALGQTEDGEASPKKKRTAKPLKDAPEGTEKPKALTKRMRSAGNDEERAQIMEQQVSRKAQIAFEKLKDSLRVSEEEWPVIQPRLQAVYDLVHPTSRMTGENTPAKTELEQKSRELRELVREDTAGPEQFKAKLAAYRAAKDRVAQELGGARQSLRQILTLRQETILILNGLLD